MLALREARPLHRCRVPRRRVTNMSDHDLIQQAIADNPGAIEDFARTAVAVGWIQHLAVPSAWAQVWPKITEPIGAFLCRQVDQFLQYAARGGRCAQPDFEGAPYDERVPRARHLRELLQAWTPPELTEAIIQAARDALYADGMCPPGGWDSLRRE